MPNAITFTAHSVHYAYMDNPAVDLVVHENGKCIGGARQREPNGEWQILNDLQERLGPDFRPNDLSIEGFSNAVQRKLEQAA